MLCSIIGNILIDYAGEAEYQSIGLYFDICSYTRGWFNTSFFYGDSSTVYSSSVY